MEISKKSLQLEGANYHPYKLVQLSEDMLAVKPRSCRIVFMCGFIAMGFLFLVISYYNKKEIDFFGFIFIFAGLYGLSYSKKSIFFDKKNGFFYNAKKTKEHIRKAKFDTIESAVILSEIHSIQVLEIHASADGDFVYYEINLVKEDGERLPVFVGDDREKILCDAQKISTFLDKIPIAFHVGQK